MSTSMVGAAPHSSEAAANHTVPITKTRRRPYRSPSAPPRRISEANASRYPVSTHCNAPTPASRSSPMCGRATLTTVGVQRRHPTPRPSRPGRGDPGRKPAPVARPGAPRRASRPSVRAAIGSQTHGGWAGSGRSDRAAHDGVLHPLGADELEASLLVHRACSVVDERGSHGSALCSPSARSHRSPRPPRRPLRRRRRSALLLRGHPRDEHLDRRAQHHRRRRLRLTGVLKASPSSQSTQLAAGRAPSVAKTLTGPPYRGIGDRRVRHRSP